jgi:hypothetical protein
VKSLGLFYTVHMERMQHCSYITPLHRCQYLHRHSLHSCCAQSPDRSGDRLKASWRWFRLSRPGLTREQRSIGFPCSKSTTHKHYRCSSSPIKLPELSHNWQRKRSCIFHLQTNYFHALTALSTFC